MDGDTSDPNWPYEIETSPSDKHQSWKEFEQPKCMSIEEQLATWGYVCRPIGEIAGDKRHETKGMGS